MRNLKFYIFEYMKDFELASSSNIMYLLESLTNNKIVTFHLNPSKVPDFENFNSQHSNN